jgi:hypothetical protein
LLRRLILVLVLIMYVPAGIVTMPPVDGNELIAAWIADVSSWRPSPTAP